MNIYLRYIGYIGPIMHTTYEAIASSKICIVARMQSCLPFLKRLIIDGGRYKVYTDGETNNYFN